MGRLFLVATPIGNLGDMSPRAVEMLREADLIAAEDTRNTIKLLNHFEIKTPQTSYHEFNKIEKAEELMGRMQEGMTIALVTDAGMPAISDPGEDLVRMALDAGIEVSIVPGPCAAVSALALSGLSTRRFVFEGFLPLEKKEREEVLDSLKKETRTIVCYEAPHRLVKSLKLLEEALGTDRRISLIKEITKLHEEIIRTTIGDAIKKYETEKPLGEYVVVIEGLSRDTVRQEEISRWEEMSVSDHMKMYTDKGVDKKEAMKMVASDRGISKRDVYRVILESENE